MEIRKLKEMEYEIVTSTIKGWEGEVKYRPLWTLIKSGKHVREMYTPLYPTFIQLS